MSKHHSTDPTDSHYMTPGARIYFRRVMIGYVVLAISGVVGTYAITQAVDKNLRNDLNTIAKKQCLAAIPTYNKLNEGLQAQIEVQRDALRLNLERGDTGRASLNRDAIKKLQDAKLDAPTKAECNKDLV